ncbi:alpha/beta hydrolase [Agromyces protaetiae]|uniref:Alpha/beta hydrolase n=1 Tax=Agromyces protaetiae TaxID=2509455 RepID=A0A4P6FAY8_9MICO|nr:alpha/beta hydrolase [Agromyces protaetiae]QAY72994.1 alpha/beta hydrolase [Agromyces protaetiae]
MSEIADVTAAGVPFVARRAARAKAPVVVAWHLLDPPSTPAGMATALPLAGFDAHLIYLGLPRSGARTEYEGFEALLESGVDMVADFFGPLHDEAVVEFPAALAEVRERLGLDVSDASPVIVLGGSAGASVAADVLATHGAAHDIRAAVLVNPMLRLRPMIDAMAGFLPAPYAWSTVSDAIADRLDFVARAPELVAGGARVLIVEGDADEPAFLDAVGAVEELGLAGVDVQYVEGAEHALADWPEEVGVPQNDIARKYDAIAVEWLRGVFAV